MAAEPKMHGVLRIATGAPSGSSSLTCITCRAIFSSPQEQREHYSGSDWHRYNLKRKAAGMAPVSKDAFEAKLQALRGAVEEPTDPNTNTGNKIVCVPCGKRFNAQKAYDAHCLSRKHRMRAAVPESALQQQPDEDEIMASKMASGRRILETECLFCSQTFQTIEKTATHMTKEHNFFIPHPEYVCDLPGLLKYLGEKVGVFNFCIQCPSRRSPFADLKAAQAHMTALNHTHFEYEGNEDEYGAFFDFTSSYSIPGENEDIPEKAAYVSPSGLELLFTDGKVAGHRELLLFYKQRIKLDDTRASVQCNMVEAEEKAEHTKKEKRKPMNPYVAAYAKRQRDQSATLGVKQNKLAVLGARR